MKNSYVYYLIHFKKLITLFYVKSIKLLLSVYFCHALTTQNARTTTTNQIKLHTQLITSTLNTHNTQITKTTQITHNIPLITRIHIHNTQSITKTQTTHNIQLMKTIQTSIYTFTFSIHIGTYFSSRVYIQKTTKDKCCIQFNLLNSLGEEEIQKPDFLLDLLAYYKSYYGQSP